MYKKRKIENYLVDIKEKIAKIKSKSKDKKLQDFLEDEDLEIIVEHSLMIIGGALSKIPQEVLLKYYDNSSYWRQIKDMRNLLVHQYWGVSIDMVFYVATKKIDELEIYIDKIIIGENIQ